MPAITFNSQIPQPTDQLSQSQPLILENFQGIDAWCAVDHETFASSNAGFHKKVTLPVQGSVPVFTSTNIGLYSLIPTANPLTTVPELFVRKQDGTKVPMTAYAAQSSTLGWALLPSGILIKWGTGTATGSTVITFSTTAPYIPFSTCYSVQVTPNNGAGGDVDEFVMVKGNPGILNFTAYGSKRATTGATTVTFNYLAIGLASL